MYIFVRIHALITIVFGILLMLFGLGLVVAGFVQNAALVNMVNTLWLAGSNIQMVDARFYASAFGLGFFLLGLAVAAAGELLLVFADVAVNTRETNQILLRMRKADQNPVVYTTMQPVLLQPVQQVQPVQAAPVEVRPVVAQPVEIVPPAGVFPTA